MQQIHPTRTTAQLQAEADRIDVSPATLMRYYAGLPVRGPQRRRIERALAAEQRPSTPPPAEPTSRKQSRPRARAA